MKFSATITMQFDTPFSPFKAENWEEGLVWAKESTLDGVEVCIANYVDLDLEFLRDRLDKLGLECSTISTGQARSLENISLLHDGEIGYHRAQERLKEHIDAATMLKSAVTLGLLRGIGTSGKIESQKRLLAERMSPIIEYAEEKNVIILLEAINRYETALLNSAADTNDFIENYLGNPKCVSVLWDVFHANIEDPSFEQAISCLGKKLHHVHLADSNRMFPGYGHLDFDVILRSLHEASYDSYISFECLNQPSLEIVRTETVSFVKHLRTITTNY